MPITSGGKKGPSYINPLYGVHGKFTLSSRTDIPYFLSTMRIERAIEELKIAEQVPPNLKNRWSLTELYQREVDRDRVNKDLVRGYLADPKKLKFFNAITIVLLPKAADGTLLDNFDDMAEGNAPPIPYDGQDEEDRQWGDSPGETRDFAGVQYKTIGEQARIRWSPEQVHAVAVDGQHRLVALGEYKEQIRKKALTPEEKETAIPIIILLLAGPAGFSVGSEEEAIRVLARELFTDLNKNAKKVDKARELILDDWSIDAQCVRTLVTSETARDEPPLLPLSLVRWQEALNRFDTSYYLNSIVHLDLLVADVLRLELPRNPMEKSEVEKFIASVDAALGNSTRGTGSPALSDGSRTLGDAYRQEYLDDDENPQTPLSRLPPSFLDAAVSAFRELHHPWLLPILTEFRPYKNLLDYARENNLIEGTFGEFWAQTAEHRGAIKDDQIGADEEWYTREIQTHLNQISIVKGEKDKADWSFKAIFQKALVRLGREIAFEQKGDLNLGTVEDLLSVMNQLHESGVFLIGAELDDYPLWTFIATNPGSGKIKVNKMVEERILSLLRLWYYANRKRQLGEPSETTPAKLLVHFEAQANVSTWPGCADAVENIAKSLTNATFLGQGYHRSKTDKNATEREGQQKRVRERIKALLKAGLPDS